MPHFVSFGRQIVGVVLIGRWKDGDLVNDVQVVAPQSKRLCLLGVVGQQADFGEPQVLQDLDPDSVIAHIGLEAK